MKTMIVRFGGDPKPRILVWDGFWSRGMKLRNHKGITGSEVLPILNAELGVSDRGDDVKHVDVDGFQLIFGFPEDLQHIHTRSQSHAVRPRQHESENPTQKAFRSFCALAILMIAEEVGHQDDVILVDALEGLQTREPSRLAQRQCIYYLCVGDVTPECQILACFRTEIDVSVQ